MLLSLGFYGHKRTSYLKRMRKHAYMCCVGAGFVFMVGNFFNWRVCNFTLFLSAVFLLFHLVRYTHTIRPSMSNDLITGTCNVAITYNGHSNSPMNLLSSLFPIHL